MPTPSLADTYVSIPELMPVARGRSDELERRLSAAEIAGLRHGLVTLGEIKQSLQQP